MAKAEDPVTRPHLKDNKHSVSRWGVRPERSKTLFAPPWSLGEGSVSDIDTPKKRTLEDTALFGSARGLGRGAGCDL